MDGDIYYIGMTSLAMIFLTWISKYKEGDLYAIYGSILFRGMCHTTMEGSFIILLSTNGKNIVFTSMGYLTQHFDALTIHIQCIAPQKGKFFFGLHGQNWANLYDGDNHILYGLGKVFSFMYDQLIYSSIFYISVDIMTYITSRVIQNNFPCNFLKQQFGKLRITIGEVVGTSLHHMKPSVFSSFYY